MGKQITFINARLIDPRVEMEKSGTLTINNGLIEKKDEGIKGKVIDCKGMCLAPGIVDILGLRFASLEKNIRKALDLLAALPPLGVLLA